MAPLWALKWHPHLKTYSKGALGQTLFLSPPNHLKLLLWKRFIDYS